MAAGDLDSRAPAFEQRHVDLDADDFEDRPGAGKEQVAAGQTAGIIERQGQLDVQSSVSGARRTPRSSRIIPS
jgi:hypothetical protein